jgi:hypothetical protein
MLGKVAKNVGLAPWELAYQQQQREATRTLFSRSQFKKEKARRVVVGDEEARRVIVTRSGHRPHLFSEDQTVELDGR